jgi:GNAT superfamily N-acetyltransferase
LTLAARLRRAQLARTRETASLLHVASGCRARHVGRGGDSVNRDRYILGLDADARPARAAACDDPRMTDREIRLASESADAEVSHALQQAFFADIASRDPGWDPDRGPSADASELGPPGGAWFIAYLDGRPVGCGGLKAVDETLGEIGRVFVDASARGRGIGLGCWRPWRNTLVSSVIGVSDSIRGIDNPKRLRCFAQPDMSRSTTSTATPSHITGWKRSARLSNHLRPQPLASGELRVECHSEHVTRALLENRAPRVPRQ